MDKHLIWLGAAVGSGFGSWVATWFKIGFLSPWSIVVSTLGGILGIWLTYKYL